jgi:hypothetical protein
MKKNGRIEGLLKGMKKETNSPKPEPWKATQNDIKENELEDSRKTLLNSYHSYVQTHAGYIIAISLGFFGFMSSIDIFLKRYELTLLFVILIGGLVILGGYMILRIVYWTSYANYATNLRLKEVVAWFNIYNSKAEHPFPEKAPTIAILQNAVKQAFESDEKAPWFKKLALKTA